jgi:DNA-binding ferritin-like protein (Dps family)
MKEKKKEYATNRRQAQLLTKDYNKLKQRIQGNIHAIHEAQDINNVIADELLLELNRNNDIGISIEPATTHSNTKLVEHLASFCA